MGTRPKREAVIRPLAEQERLSVAAVEKATPRPRLSRSVLVWSKKSCSPCVVLEQAAETLLANNR